MSVIFPNRNFEPPIHDPSDLSLLNRARSYHPAMKHVGPIRLERAMMGLALGHWLRKLAVDVPQIGLPDPKSQFFQLTSMSRSWASERLGAKELELHGWSGYRLQ